VRACSSGERVPRVEETERAGSADELEARHTTPTWLRCPCPTAAKTHCPHQCCQHQVLTGSPSGLGPSLRHFAVSARPMILSSVREESATGTEREREAGTSRGRVGKSGGQEHSLLDLDGGIDSGPSCDAGWRGDGHGSHTGSKSTCARDTHTVLHALLDIPAILKRKERQATLLNPPTKLSRAMRKMEMARHVRHGLSGRNLRR
jgi:hypothetical protein